MNLLYILFIVLCLLDLFISYKKINNKISIIAKIIIVIGMILTAVLGKLSYNICSCLALLTSLCDIYLFKDKNEEYFLSIKLGLFLFNGLKFLRIKAFKDSLIFFAINIIILLKYISSKNRWAKNIDIALLIGLNVLSYIGIEYKLIPHVLCLLMSFIDYYLIYIKEAVNNKKARIALDILYVLLLMLNTAHMVYMLSSKFILIFIVLYALMVAATKKDKVVFIVSLLGFLLGTMYYFVFMIDNRSVVYLLSVVMTFICYLLFDAVILKKRHD